MKVIAPIIAGELTLLPLKGQAPSRDAARDPPGDDPKIRFICPLPAVQRFMPQHDIHQVTVSVRHRQTTNCRAIGQDLHFHAPRTMQRPGLDLASIAQRAAVPARPRRRLLRFCHPDSPHEFPFLSEI